MGGVLERVPQVARTITLRRECKIVCVLGQNKQTMMKKLEGEEDDQNQTDAISGGTD
jgi:hypothetical protein